MAFDGRADLEDLRAGQTQFECRIGEQRARHDRRRGRAEPTADGNVRGGLDRRAPPPPPRRGAARGAPSPETPREEILIRPHGDSEIGRAAGRGEEWRSEVRETGVK